MEVENEKLRQDYQLLRNSIDRGVESRELEGMLLIDFIQLHIGHRAFYQRIKLNFSSICGTAR